MAMVMIVCRMTAFLGVLYFGCTAPSHFGRAPLRPIEKKTRVHALVAAMPTAKALFSIAATNRSEEHTSELQSRSDLVCRLLLEKKKISLNHLNNDQLSHLLRSV